MSTHTINYNLVKPDYSDTADIADINGNMDIIDTKFKEVEDSTAENTDDITSLGTDLATLSATVTGISTGKQDILTKGTVAANTNLDTVATPGNYWLNSTYGNLPHSGSAAGVLEVIVPNTSVVMQKYTRFQGSSYAVYNIFFRLRVNGTWYPWKTALIVS